MEPRFLAYITSLWLGGSEAWKQHTDGEETSSGLVFAYLDAQGDLVGWLKKGDNSGYLKGLQR